MKIRRLGADDGEALMKLHSMCYLYEMTREEYDRQAKESLSDSTLGFGAFTDGGELIASVLDNRLTMRLDGGRYAFSGVGGVATHPAYRRGGAVRDLIGAILQQARADGCVFSGLYPFSHPFYRKFGFETGRVETVCTFGFDQLKPFAGDIDARMLPPGDDRAALLPVYEAFTSAFNLALGRDSKCMNDLLKSDPYTGNRYAYAIEDGGAPAAYVCYTREREEGNNVLRVVDFAYATGAGFRKLLGFLYRLSAEFKKIRIALPDGVPLPWITVEPYDVTAESSANFMIRALDCRRALEGVKKCGARFIVDIRDDFLPENSGRYLVDGDRVKPTDAPADAEMSVQAFSQLVTGGVAFDAALLRDDVRCERNIEAFRNTFVKKPTYAGVYF